MQNIYDIFNEETIEYYKKHKDEITFDLLSKLRQYGNEGKQIAIDILETEVDDDNYYLDSFNNRIKFRGRRELKRAYTKMTLSPIHIEEIKRCAESLEYYRDNYVKIRTKSGVNFPELREYQNGFLKVLESDAESIVSLQPRQSGKSVTLAIYCSHLLNFDNDKIIGICASEEDLACEFLQNIQNIFLELPMWLKVGMRTWNAKSVESENKMKILTDKASKKSFRGFTISLLIVDETAFIDPTEFYKFIDSVAPTQSALAWKKNVFISTANGMNHFYKMVEGAKNRLKFIDLEGEKYKSILEKYKGKILDDKENLNGLRDVVVNEPSNGYVLYEVNWRDVPRYDNKGRRLDPDEFREKIVSKYGLVYFNQNYSCVSGNTKINIYDTLSNKEIEITIGELYDRIYGKNSNIKFINSGRYKVLTSDGYSDFDGISKKIVNKTLNILLENNKSIEVSENHNFIIQNVTVKAKTLKVGDCLELKDNILERIIDIKILNEKKEVYDILETKNHSYYANDILNHNCQFLGSSYTLLNPDVLRSFKYCEPDVVWDNMLKVYFPPVKGHKYIMGVDAAKGANDAFAVQILDITSLPFKQVAVAQIFKCNYLIMPEFICEWATRYNRAFVIVENNEGAGTFVASMLQIDYEYDNLYTVQKGPKIEAGFRTTTKTRPQILETFQHFTDNHKCEIIDFSTITEANTFIIKDNKYQADNGCHDDLIMCLALCFVPFIDNKNFDNMKELISKIHSKDNTDIDISDYMIIGDFDDFSDDNKESLIGKSFDNEYFISGIF